VGKGTMVARLMAANNLLRTAISATTRDPRPGDVEGQTYYFWSAEAFQKGIEAGEFVEWALVHDHYYGTLHSEIGRIGALGCDVLLEIDTQGYELVRAQVPSAYGIFIEPPSFAELEHRLRARGTDSEESIQTRLHNARLELACRERYNTIITNDDLETAVQELITVVAAVQAGVEPART
jgi:guanylate kinase